jgi:hypothetical protein
VEHVARGEAVLRWLDRRPVRPLHEPFVEPGPVRSAPREPALDRVVGLESALRVERDHLPGRELAAVDAAVAVERYRAGLRRAHDEPVLAHGVAQRAQAVAVERGADDPAVREDQPGRPVPRLDQAGVVAEEVPHLARELLVSLPGGRQQHRHAVPDVASAVDDEVERVVEHRRVGARLVEDGMVELVVGRPKVPLAGAHPVHVPLNRVDLAVVAEEPEGLCPLPGGCGVRGETLVEDPERNLERRVREVEVERAELIGSTQRLVRDEAIRHRDDVRAAGPLGQPPRAVHPPLRLLVRDAVRSAEGELLDEWSARLGLGAEMLGVDRHGAP